MHCHDNTSAKLQAMLDVLVVLVRGCGVGGVPGEVVREVFPRVVRRALSCNDSAILQVSHSGRSKVTLTPWLLPQNAGECVRAFVATSAEQLAQW